MADNENISALEVAKAEFEWKLSYGLSNDPKWALNAVKTVKR